MAIDVTYIRYLTITDAAGKFVDVSNSWIQFGGLIHTSSITQQIYLVPQRRFLFGFRLF